MLLKYRKDIVIKGTQCSIVSMGYQKVNVAENKSNMLTKIIDGSKNVIMLVILLM